MTNRKIQYWVIPPEADAEFVAAMEAVLDTYEKPYDPDHPVLCMDEQPVQLIKETRQPIPATQATRQAGRLRIRAGRHGEHLHVHRAAGRLARGDGAGHQDEAGLGRGSGPPAGRALPQVSDSDLGLRQPEHAHDRRVLRGVPAGACAGHGPPHCTSATRRSTAVG